MVLSNSGLTPPSTCLAWQNCLLMVPTTYNQNRRNRWSTAKKAKKSSSSNKRWQKKVGSLGCRYQSCNPAVNVWNVAERRPTIWEQINFVAVSSKWLGFDTFIEIYWNDSNKQLSKCSSALSTLVGWHFEASMPKIIYQKFWNIFSPKRLKYRRRKNLEHYLKITKSETNMIQCLKNKNTKKNFETCPEK